MNKTNQNIIDFLDYYCAHEAPLRYAVLIKGKWGAGKSHLVRSFLDGRDKIKTLYISLYGMKDITDIEDAFFAQLHPALASKGMKVAAAVFKGILKSAIKIDLGEIDRAKVNVEGTIPELGLPNFLKDTGERVLIFDDLERSEISIKKLLGYINSFVEHDDSKVILIANEDEIDPEGKAAYDKIKEKLVGKTFEIEADFSAAADEFTKSLQDLEIRQFFAMKRKKLETIFQQSETDNLRILQQAMWDFERLVLQMDQVHRKNIEALDAVFGPYIALSFEVRAGRWKASDMKEIDTTGWARIIRSQKGEPSIRDELGKRYPEVKFEQSLIGNDILEDALFRSALDKDKIRARLAASPFFAKPADVPAWRRLWHHFSVPDEMAEAAFTETEEQFAKQELVIPGVILQIFGLRLEMAEIGLLAKTKEAVVNECRAYVDSLYAAKKLPPLEIGRERFDDTRRHYDGLGYYQNETKEFRSLVDHLCAVRGRVLEDSYPAVAVGLMEDMAKKPDLFYRRLNLTNDADNIFYDIPIMKYASPADFVVRLTAMPKASIRTALLAFKGRYEFIRQHLALVDELDWLGEVERLLLAQAETKGPLGRYDLKNAVQDAISAPLKHAKETLAEISAIKQQEHK